MSILNMVLLSIILTVALIGAGLSLVSHQAEAHKACPKQNLVGVPNKYLLGSCRASQIQRLGFATKTLEQNDDSDVLEIAELSRHKKSHGKQTPVTRFHMCGIAAAGCQTRWAFIVVLSVRPPQSP